jgi:hypothetical protein
MALNLTTRLEAVNTMLGTIGEAPVNALTGTTADAALAQSLLDEASREVQSAGWKFNTETDVTLVRTTDGKIPLGNNILRINVDPTRFADIDPVQRGDSLYDAKGHSYVFPKDILAEIVYLLEFEKLPEQARRYITIRAARIFQARYVGSQQLEGFALRDEQAALVNLQDAQADSGDYTIFDSYDTARPLYRR